MQEKSFTTAPEDNEADYVDLRVMTLNCWGLYGVSSLRNERMHAIAKYLAESDFDIVLLQEVWCQEDFDLIALVIRDTYPHSLNFDQGIIGSGTCIFSRYRLSNANFHEFAMNGYPLKFWHGDWFAAKGLGVCQLEVKGIDVTLFLSHYHAEYDPNHDIYLGHRVIHGLESAQWLNMTAGATDLTLYCGDFNTEPESVPYKLLRNIVPLNDAWVEFTGEPFGGETNEIKENSFTPLSKSKAKRIDYIMYRAGPGIEAETVNCWLPLPNRVPDKSYSYSDHEAVAAIIRVRQACSRDGDHHKRGPAFRRHLSFNTRSDTVVAVQEAIDIVDKSLKTVDSDQTKYVIYSFFLLLILVLSFIPVVLKPDWAMALDMTLFVPRFFLSSFLLIFFLMATLFNKRERNALTSTRKELQLIIEQDYGYGTFTQSSS